MNESRPDALHRVAMVLNIGAKLTLAALIAFYLLRPDLDQFAGKVMPLRTLLYPLAAAMVPVVWWLTGRGRPYPHLIDALVTLPTVVDYGGNAAGFYAHEGFDHLVHLVNTSMLTLAFGLALTGWALPRLATAGLTLGFGSVLHTVWEIIEFHLDTLFDAGLDVAAQTTIRDFMAGITGASASALVVWWHLREREGGRRARGAGGPSQPGAR
ncbi:MAG: hypothetical protein RIB67_03650 [Miltoncostaeaceae bacterium]